jgi:antitoxin YefM
MEDNEALDETTYLLRSPENARRLLKSIEEIEKASQTKKFWFSER